MIPLADNENKSYEVREKCHIYQTGFVMIKMK